LDEPIARDFDEADASADLDVGLRRLHGAVFGRSLAATEPGKVAWVVDVEANTASELHADG